jgi:hypothetical protein
MTATIAETKQVIMATRESILTSFSFLMAAGIRNSITRSVAKIRIYCVVTDRFVFTALEIVARQKKMMAGMMIRFA